MENEWNDDFDYIDYAGVKKGKKRKKNRIPVIIIVIVSVALILILAAMLFGTWFRPTAASENSENNTGLPAFHEEQITYTQQELEAKVAEAVAAAEAEDSAEAERVLEGIKAGLTSGLTYVEALRPFYPNDMLVVSSGQFHFVPIQEELKKNDYTQENLNILETGEYQYLENGQVISHKGIDVSKHQGVIDWQQVAEDGVEFAFIRVGLRGYGTGKLVEDEYFEQNIQGALSAGIKVGVYVFSQAVTEEEVLEEANFVLEKIAPYRVECPVVFDVEKVSGDGRMNALSVEERTNITLLFCQTIENAGYKPMIYHNMEMGALMLDLETLENYDKWFAYYNEELYYPYEYKIWQYSHTGSVKGITGDVDLNISFEPVWE